LARQGERDARLQRMRERQSDEGIGLFTAAHAQRIAQRVAQANERAQERESRETFFASQVRGSAPAPTGAMIKPGSTKPVTGQQLRDALPERYQALASAAERVKMPQAGWNQPISEAQKGYLGSLAAKAHTNTAAGSAVRATADELIQRIPKLTKWEASQLIDAMKQPKPFTTLIARARNVLTGDSRFDDPGRALFALPGFRAGIINSVLNEQALAEGLPF